MNIKLVKVVLIMLLSAFHASHVMAEDSGDTYRKNAINTMTCLLTNDMAYEVIEARIIGGAKDEVLDFMLNKYLEVLKFPGSLKPDIEKIIDRIYGVPKHSAHAQQVDEATSLFARCVVNYDLVKYKKKIFYCKGYSDIVRAIYFSKEKGTPIGDVRERHDLRLANIGFTADIVGKIYSSDLDNGVYQLKISQACAKTHDQPFQFFH